MRSDDTCNDKASVSFAVTESRGEEVGGVAAASEGRIEVARVGCRGEEEAAEDGAEVGADSIGCLEEEADGAQGAELRLVLDALATPLFSASE
jgi:hypothetical protein